MGDPKRCLTVGPVLGPRLGTIIVGPPVDSEVGMELGTAVGAVDGFTRRRGAW